MQRDPELEKWIDSADAWVSAQGQEGDWSRRAILDPALEKLLPDMQGKTVLDLGCGEGRYSRKLKTKGAGVTGIYPVPPVIAHARKHDADSTYVEGRAEKLPFDDGSFDVVLSYLSVVDIPDLDVASLEISRVLRPGGRLVVVTISNVASPTPGWVKGQDGSKIYRTVDRYMEHFAMDLAWSGIKIRNFHRPLSYVLGLFLNQDFVLTQFVEPLPLPSDPSYVDERRVPTFQLFALTRSAG